MIVLEENFVPVSVPIYEVICPECKSVVQYVFQTVCRHIECPFCGCSASVTAIRSEIFDKIRYDEEDKNTF